MLPRGVVTFLFTDIEGSTDLMRRVGQSSYGLLLRSQEDRIRSSVAAQGGSVVSTSGDAVFAAFADAGAAILAALAAQDALRGDAAEEHPVRVRMGLHLGPAEPVNGDYVALAVHQAARIVNAANGAQILCTAAVASAAAAAQVAWHDWGRFRLRDFDEPQALLEPHPRSGRPHERAPRAPSARPGGLPRPRTSLVGREAELESLSELLDRERLVTLVAAGGAGKTRLAVEAAQEALERFGGYVVFVDLAALDDPGRVPAVAARAAGAAEDPQRDPLDLLVEHLGARRLLLVVDNCEHLLDAAAALVDTVLSETEHVVVLATSRTALGVSGERRMRVEPLALPTGNGDQVEQWRDAAASDAVRLFVERATAADPAFSLTPNNVEHVVALVRELEGMPLAIELAAGRAAALGVATLHERLHEQLRVLSATGRGVPERHRTLEAVIAWSHSLLADSEKILLRRLSVFAGGFTLAAAEAVARSGQLPRQDVVGALGNLTEKNLVRLLDTDSGGSARYRLLVAVGLFAAGKLDEAGERQAVERRHIELFTDAAENATRELRGADPFTTQASFAADLSNLDIALQRALVSDPVAALRLAVAMSRPRSFLGGHIASRDALRDSLRAAGDQAPRGLAAHANIALGRIAFLAEGQYHSAIDLLSSAASSLEQEGDPEGRDLARIELAEAKRSLGQHEEARALLHAAIESCDARGDHFAAAYAEFRLAVVLDDEERFAEALGHARSAKARWQRLESVLWCAAADDLAAMILINLGDTQQAVALARTALPVFERLDDKRSSCLVRIRIASAEQDLGRPAMALPHVRDAWRLASDAQLRTLTSETLLVGARALIALGDTRTGAMLLGCCQAIDKSGGRPSAGGREAELLQATIASVTQHLGADGPQAMEEGAALANSNLFEEVARLFDEAVRSSGSAAGGENL